MVTTHECKLLITIMIITDSKQPYYMRATSSVQLLNIIQALLNCLHKLLEDV